MTILVYAINLIFDLLIILIIVNVVLSYILPNPYHPVREFLGRILNPLLTPIRRLLPQGGMIDFSPMILILLLIIIQYVIGAILRSI